MNTKEAKIVGKKIYAAWKVFLWVLRWLSIVLFGVLFFVGVYFKLPPKVLACLAVIPVVGIFVPKKIQPWVWGSLTVLLLSIWGWVHLPEQNSSAWQPYQYDQTLEAIKREHLPRGINNAADQYEAIFDTHGETIFYYTFDSEQERQLTFSSPWNPEIYPALDTWMSSFDPAVRQIVDAAGIEQCRFEIPANLAAMKPQLQRINQIKGWTQLLIRSANRDLFSGRQRQALAKLLAIPQMAQHLYQQQTLFDQSGAFHIELMGVRALEAFMVRQCDDPNMLSQIEQAYMKINPQWPKNWPPILAREKLTVKNIAGLLYEVNDSGKVRISHNSMMALQRGLGYRPQRLFINQQVMNRLAVIGLSLSLPLNPERLEAMVDRRFDHFSLQVQKGQPLPRYRLRDLWLEGLNIQSVVDWLVTAQVGYYWALDGQFQRHLAIVNQTRIFSSLKRYYLEHGHWPKQLEDLDIQSVDEALIDPLCGRPFVYGPVDGEFRLYSLGPNGTDDLGRNDPDSEEDDILLWPRDYTPEFFGLEE